MAKIEITVEQARGLFQYSDLREELLKAFTRAELGFGPKLREWSEIPKAGGYFVRGKNIDRYQGAFECNPSEYTRDIFATKKQAQAALAMAQLSILMKDLGEECELDWSDKGEYKYVIAREIDKLVVGSTRSTDWHFLAFRSKEVRDAFLSKHWVLIRQYFMLGDD